MELILWGIPKGETDSLYAQVLYTQAKTEADIERIKALASKDGWHSFSIQRIDGTIPDFGKGVSK